MILTKRAQKGQPEDVPFVSHTNILEDSAQAFSLIRIDHFRKGSWPIQNHGELAVLYCFVFLYISMRGDGTLSIRSLGQGRSPK